MSIERIPHSVGENKETIKESSWISRLQSKFRNAALTVMLAVGSVTGASMVASTAGCTFDKSGLAMPNDAGDDADADADADVPDADADADADVPDADADADAAIPDEICNNNLDDDEDGLKDCADPDCNGQAGPGGGTCNTTENCGDGYDNNGDGVTDCEDVITCEGFEDPRGFECTVSGDRKETNCTDGIDNDGDWAEDCDDPDCVGTPACTVDPEICDNNIDDDGDFLVDCADIADCGGYQDFTDGWKCDLIGDKVETDCSDGLDNDGDGHQDCSDSDCNNSSACGESCDNGIDDDTDGLIDCADPDCDNFSNGLITCAYGKTWETNCVDGINNDGNGTTDCADPICTVMPVCGGGVEICDDGLDNDGDGFIDCLDGACVLNARCTPWTFPGGTAAGQLCPTWLPTPCNIGRTAQVTLTCVPTDLTCY